METVDSPQSSTIVSIPVDLTKLPPSPFDVDILRQGKPGKLVPLSGDVLAQLNADASSITPRMVSWNDTQLVNVREYEISETCPSVSEGDWETAPMQLRCCTIQ